MSNLRSFKFILILLSLYLSVQTYAQSTYYFNKIWEADTAIFIAPIVQPLEDGNYWVVTGVSEGPNHKEVVLRKIDSLGNEIWSNKIDTGEEYRLALFQNDLIVNQDSSYVFFFLYDWGGIDRDIRVVKFNKEGEVLWKKIHGTPNATDVMLKGIETYDGGYLMVGWQQGEEWTAPTDMYVIKLDKEGDFEWDKIYHFNGNRGQLFGATQTDDGHYIIAGRARHQTAQNGGHLDLALLKIDTLGNIVGEQYWGTTEDDCGAKITQIDANEFKIYSCLDLTNGPFLYKAKVNDSLDLIWERTYSLPFYESVAGLGFFSYPSKDHKIASVIYGNELEQAQPLLIKFAEDEEIEWIKEYTINPEEYVYLRDAEATLDGGYVFAGYQQTGQQRGWVLKIDSLGNTCMGIGCDSVYTLPMDTIPPDTIPDTTVVVPPDTIPDTTTSVGSIDEVFSPQSSKEYSIQIYPNPSSGMVQVRYQFPPYISEGVLELYNQNGTLLGERMLPSFMGQLPLSTKGLPSGVYLWRLVVQQGEIESGKLLVE